jgi:hypothetical protein
VAQQVVDAVAAEAPARTRSSAVAGQAGLQVLLASSSSRRWAARVCALLRAMRRWKPGKAAASTGITWWRSALRA